MLQKYTQNLVEMEQKENAWGAERRELQEKVGMLKQQCIEFKTERDAVFQTIKALRLELQEKVRQNEDLSSQKAQIKAQFEELNLTSIVQYHIAKNQRLESQNDMQQDMITQL